MFLDCAQSNYYRYAYVAHYLGNLSILASGKCEGSSPLNRGEVRLK